MSGPPGAPPPRRPTLADVAAQAGVSVSTASLTFSGAGPVSEATRDRVLAAAAALSYAGPDPRGRSLRQGRSGIIAVATEDTIVDAFRDPVMVLFADGIATELAPAGLSMLLLPGIGSGATSIETAPVDAAVFVGCSPRITPSVAAGRRRGIPLVAMGGTLFADVPTVDLDDRRATVTLCRHLAELGHRRVAVTTLPLDGSGFRGVLPQRDERSVEATVGGDRLAGARDVFPEPVVYVGGKSSVEEGYRAGTALLTSDAGALLPAGERPSAVIAQSDLLAAGVIRAAEQLGLAVPRDLSVVGFDGVRIDTFISHDLTTMEQPAREQGQAAGRMVLDLLAGGSPPSQGFTSVFHRGATTAPPPGG